jgi:hypothetical protein
VSVHSSNLVQVFDVTPAQRNTLRLIAVNGLDCKLLGQDPYSLALISECYDTHKFHDGMDSAFSLPVFTVITASGQTYCPYSE